MDITKEKKTLDKVTVVGLGHSGIKILNCLGAMTNIPDLNLVAIDTDQRSLDKSTAPTKIAAGMKWTNGQGCGGEVFKGQRAVATVRPEIRDAIDGSSLVIITGGLGGGTATSGACIVAGSAKDKSIPVVALMTTPFAFEGHTKRKVSDSGIKDILLVADVLLCLPNDLLYSAMTSDVSLEVAFHKADAEVSRSIIGVGEMLRCSNLLSSDFADFKALLNRRKSRCSIGVGLTQLNEDSQRSHIALERLISSPLLGGVELIKTADVLFVSLLGGSDLEIGEMKKAFESIERMAGKKTRLIVGANTDSKYDQVIQLTAVAVKYEQKVEGDTDTVSLQPGDKPKTQKIVKAAVKESDELDFGGQLEFDLQPISRGIFTSTEQTMYDGEDLDVPTFQRRGDIIDKGV